MLGAGDMINIGMLLSLLHILASSKIGELQNQPRCSLPDERIKNMHAKYHMAFYSERTKLCYLLESGWDSRKVIS